MNIRMARIINFIFFDISNKIFFIALAFMFTIMAFAINPPPESKKQTFVVGNVDQLKISHPDDCKLSVKKNDEGTWQVICTMTK